MRQVRVYDGLDPHLVEVNGALKGGLLCNRTRMRESLFDTWQDFSLDASTHFLPQPSNPKITNKNWRMNFISAETHQMLLAVRPCDRHVHAIRVVRKLVRPYKVVIQIPCPLPSNSPVRLVWCVPTERASRLQRTLTISLQNSAAPRHNHISDIPRNRPGLLQNLSEFVVLEGLAMSHGRTGKRSPNK